MKLNLIFLLNLISIFCFSQNDLKAEIELLSFDQHRGCDTVNNQKFEGFELGELPLKIEIQTALEFNGFIQIIGVVKAKYSDEPIQHCQIWTGKFEDKHCEYINHLGSTDSTGKFEIEFYNQKRLSIYFLSLSFIDYELKIGTLLK